MDDVQAIPVGAALAYTVDFSDQVPAGQTVSSVVWTAPSPLVLDQQGDDLGNCRSTIRVSGALHGRSYLLEARATLSNGEAIPKDVTLRGFNG